MKIKNLKVYGLEESMIRSGYPMQVGEPITHSGGKYEDELDSANSTNRANKLANTPIGSGHNNFLKGIIVQFDLQFPEYFSPQLQRYSWIDIVSSQSKMHRIMSRSLTEGDFVKGVHPLTIELLNKWVQEYKDESDPTIKKTYFQKVITNLPCGYLKWMGISTNYLQLKTIYKQRRRHKLEEWQYFCDWIEELPMSELIISK